MTRLLALVAMATSIAACRAPPPSDVYEFWVEAENHRDLAAQMLLLADDAVLTGWDFCLTRCVGRAAIRRQLEQLTV